MSKIDIQRFIKSIKKRRSGAQDVEVMYPAREWAIGIGAVLIMFLLGGFMSQQLYMRIQQSTEVTPVVTTPSVPYQAAVVEEALRVFALRQEQYNTYATNRVAPAEPVESVEDAVTNTDVVPGSTQGSSDSDSEVVDQSDTAAPTSTSSVDSIIDPIVSPDTLPAPVNGGGQ